MNPLQRLIAKTFADKPTLLADAAAETQEEYDLREVQELAERRAESRRMWQDNRRRNCGMAGEQFDHTFERFKFAGSAEQRRTQSAALEKMRAFAEAFPKVERGAMIWGTNGVGKDFLLHCVINRLLERGVWDIRYWYALDYDKALRDEWDSHGEDATRTEEIARDCRVLMIGDLHIICASGHQGSVRASAMRLLNRASDVGQPIMCATSNWSPEEFNRECLSSVGSRASKAFSWHELRGPDRRRLPAGPPCPENGEVS